MSKSQSRHAGNHCKRILKSATLTLANKKGRLSLPRNLFLPTLDKSLKAFSTIVNLLFLLYLIALRSRIFHLRKQSFPKFFQLEISSAVFSSGNNPKIHNIHRIPKMTKKIVNNIDFFKEFGPVVSCKKCDPQRSCIAADLFNKSGRTCFSRCWKSQNVRERFVAKNLCPLCIFFLLPVTSFRNLSIISMFIFYTPGAGNLQSCTSMKAHFDF